MKSHLLNLAGAGALLLSGALALAGPTHSHPLKPRPLRQNVTAPASAASYGVMLGMDHASYPKAATAHATLTLFNDTGTPLTFMEHGQRVSWQIVDAQGNVVWDYAKGRMFPHFVLRRSLGQMQTKMNYAQDIPLAAQDGAPLPAGRYWLRGRVIGAQCAAEIGFTVTDAPSQ